MVQKDKRRSSLILGILLALLLGVAAAFFVLAMPIRMLETVTTFTQLSKLMVQAEPPISPNDRTLLAVLAGILTAGIGWVLVDWLLFGSAGMKTIIKPREDEYEDEDGDSFRPTDPLDLVSPVSLPMPDWSGQPSGDARRPLSARTDIGDPPLSPFAQQAEGLPPIGQAPPPLGQILPGVGASVPPLQPAIATAFGQASAPAAPMMPPPLATQPATGGIWGTPATQAPDAGPQGSWPPQAIPTAGAAPVATSANEPAPLPPGVPSWLPAPGTRPDGVQPRPAVESEEARAPIPAAIAPISDHPVIAASVPSSLDAFASSPLDAFAPPPAMPAPPPLAYEAPLFEPLVTPPPVAAAAPPPPSLRDTLAEPGFDMARLEDLLARLERGLQKRRAAASAARAAPTPVAPAPVVPPPAAAVQPPAGYAAPELSMPQPASMLDMTATQQLPALDPIPATSPIAAPPPLQPTVPSASGSQNDGLLDQPLHLTLDHLRNMVRR